MANHLFFASTPFNMLTASMVAFDLPEADNKYLCLIDQPEKDSTFIQALLAWAESPFNAIQIVTRKAPKQGKRKQRHKDFRNIDRLLAAIEPTHIYTGNDRRIEFQYAMAHCTNSPCGIYVDDGTYTYLGRKTHWVKDHILDNWVKKLAYGMWWQQPETIGASVWVNQCIVAFPDKVNPKLKDKTLRPLPENLNRVEFRAFAERSVALYPTLKEQLAKTTSLLLLPHESVMDLKFADKLSDAISVEKGLTSFKHHPRTINKGIFALPENTIELPAELPMEILLPLISSNCSVYGDISTALLTAKWLRPELNVTAFCKNTINPDWSDLLANLNIETCY